MNAGSDGQTTKLNSPGEGGGPGAVRRRRENAPHRRACATRSRIEHPRSGMVLRVAIEAIASPGPTHRVAPGEATLIETP